MDNRHEITDRCGKILLQISGLYADMLSIVKEKIEKIDDLEEFARLNDKQVAIMRQIDAGNREIGVLLGDTKDKHEEDRTVFASYFERIGVTIGEIKSANAEIEKSLSQKMSDTKQELKQLNKAQSIIRKISRKDDYKRKGRFIDKKK